MPNVMSVHLDAIALNHRVGEQLVSHFGRHDPRLRGLRRREIELEVLPLADVLDAAVAERMQRVGDGLSLRIEHGRFERDEHTCAHAYTPTGTDGNTRSRTSST